jgi:hypothetical protein
MKKVLKPGFVKPDLASVYSKKVGRRSRKLLTEDEWTIKPAVMPRPSKCPPVYICVPVKCPESKKTCQAGMKKVLKRGFVDCVPLSQNVKTKISDVTVKDPKLRKNIYKVISSSPETVRRQIMRLVRVKKKTKWFKDDTKKAEGG